MPEAKVNAFTSKSSDGGQVCDLPQSGVTCIVGGNNVGKSQLLRDLLLYARTFKTQELVLLSEVDLDLSPSTAEEMSQWITASAKSAKANYHGELAYEPYGGGVEVTPVEAFDTYTRASRDYLGLGHLTAFLVSHSSAGQLTALAVEDERGSYAHGRAFPLDLLFFDGAAEETLSDLCLEVFGTPVTLDRLARPPLLRLGQPQSVAPPLDRPTVEYARELASMPALNRQGDGMKSLIGLALLVLTTHCKMLLIDEPEAFLHPAQARAAGRWLARQAKLRDIQIIMATHDRDILLGLLDSAAGGDVTVVHVAREESESRLNQLSATDLKAVWGAPVLRYSNVLQGLFHRQAVVCESDADCRFFGAVLDGMAGPNQRSIADDILFVPSGGKQRVGQLTKALTSLGVRTWSIVDFDVLRTGQDIRRVVEGAGFNVDADFQKNYSAVASDLNPSGGWDRAKKSGLAAINPGPPTKAAEFILSWLRVRRVLVVPVGEMEDLDRSVSLQKSEWVSAVLEADGHLRCTGAKELLEPLLQVVASS